MVISGDTIYSDRLVEVAKGTDLLLHEALSKSMMTIMQQAAERAGRANLAKIAGDVLDYHTSPEEAARAAEAAGARALVLHHIVPPLPTKLLYSAFLGDAESEFSGDITIGEDGIAFSLPPDSVTITRTSLF